MSPAETADVQLQTDVYLDARAAELAGQDPLLLDQAPLQSGAALSDSPDQHLDPELFSARSPPPRRKRVGRKASST
jgi:hypothetical protein